MTIPPPLQTTEQIITAWRIGRISYHTAIRLLALKKGI